MSKLIKSLAGAVILSGLLTACSTPTDPGSLYQGQTPEQIFYIGKKAMINGSYAEAVKRFEALDVQYPYSPETESAQLYLIYGYYMKEDYALSTAAADHYIELHPTSPHVDYAYYMRGVANYYENIGFMERLFTLDLAKRDLAQIEKSFNDFNILVTQYPNSRYAPPAHQYMVYLRNVLADHELHVAEYYYNRKAYVASAERASGLVAHYQGAPQTLDGLAIMAKSYHQLGLRKLEQDTRAVIHYNYPNLPADFATNYAIRADHD